MAYIKWIKLKMCCVFGLHLCSTSYAMTSHDLFVTTLSLVGYAQWNVSTPHLCVLNNQEVSNTLQNLIHQQKYPYQVKSVSMNTLTGNVCNVLLFSNLEPEQEHTILNTFATPVLSISLNNTDCQLGSAFCLYQRNNRTSFKINMNSLTRSQIHIDPRVLLLAKSMELP